MSDQLHAVAIIATQSSSGCDCEEEKKSQDPSRELTLVV